MAIGGFKGLQQGQLLAVPVAAALLQQGPGLGHLAATLIPQRHDGHHADTGVAQLDIPVLGHFHGQLRMATQALQFELTLGTPHLGLGPGQLRVAGHHLRAQPIQGWHRRRTGQRPVHLELCRQGRPDQAAQGRTGLGNAQDGALGALLGVQQLRIGLDQFIARGFAGLHAHRYSGTDLLGQAQVFLRGTLLRLTPQEIEETLVETGQQIHFKTAPFGLARLQPGGGGANARLTLPGVVDALAEGQALGPAGRNARHPGLGATSQEFDFGVGISPGTGDLGPAGVDHGPCSLQGRVAGPGRIAQGLEFVGFGARGRGQGRQKRRSKGDGQGKLPEHGNPSAIFQRCYSSRETVRPRRGPPEPKHTTQQGVSCSGTPRRR